MGGISARWFCCLWLLLMSGAVSGFEITAETQSEDLTRHIFHLQGPDAAVSVVDAERLWREGLFKPVTGDTLITSLNAMPEWFGFQLQLSDDALRGREWVISTQDVMHLTRLVLHVPVFIDGQPGYQRLQDSLHNFDQPAMGTPISSFLIDQSFDESRPFFVEVDGKLPLNARLLLQSRSAASWESTIRIAFFCLAFGVVLGLGIYNLILYFFVRDKVYLLYVVYALTMLIWQMQISGFFFFLDRQFGNDFYHALSPNFTTGIANLAGSLFTISFLRLRYQNQWQGAAILLVALANLFIGLATLGELDSSIYTLLHRSQFVLSGLSAAAIVIPTIILVRKGFRFALPFMLAWGFLGTGIVLLAVGYRPVLYGVQFPVGYNVLSSMAIEMILMSYALGLRIKGIQSEASRLEALSITDGLTGLYNQRHLHNLGPELLEKTPQVPGFKWAYVIIDIDHFKSFNDNYGHQIGDRVLKMLGKTIEQHIRHEDYAFRAGGEEFVLLMSVRQQEQAVAVMERIRESFQQLEIEVPGGQVVNCSLSAGVAVQHRGETAQQLFEIADKALYKAKGAGRNRVLLAVA